MLDFGSPAMTSLTTTPLAKVSTSRMAAALFSSPLVSTSASAPSSLSPSSSASSGTLQAFSPRATSALSSAFSASRSTFSWNIDFSLPQRIVRRAPSISPSNLISCALPSATTLGGVISRSRFGSSGSGSPSDRPANMTTTANASSAAAPASANSIYDFTVKDIEGNEINLGEYKGKVLLIVNVASTCGLTTGNYTELAQVYSELKDSGLEILAFPCNQFGNQESGSNAQIKEFACTRFKAEYPIFDKIDVNGPNTAPIYQYLKSKKGGGILGNSIKWNFAKFLIDKEGNVVERYAPTTSPKKIMGDIKKLIGQ